MIVFDNAGTKLRAIESALTSPGSEIVEDNDFSLEVSEIICFKRAITAKRADSHVARRFVS